MKTQSAQAATENEDGLLDKVYAFIQTAKAEASDGLTWAEFGELLLAMIRLVVPFLDTVKAMSGAEKKSFALDCVARLFDAVADYAVPVAAYPIWLIARPAVRSLVLALASGAIEQVLAMSRS